MLLLDTSTTSAFMHRDPRASRRLRDEDPTTVYLCAPVAAEICFGLARPRAGSRRQRLLASAFGRLRAALRWADWSEPASSAFGQRKATLRQRGTPTGDKDLAKASIALRLPARLARHFARIDDLELVDWSGSEQS